MPPFKLTRDRLRRLTPKTVVTQFDCGDADLNEFLLKDAPPSTAQLMTVTYLVMDDTGTDVAAFFSLSNDKLTYDPAPSNITLKILAWIAHAISRIGSCFRRSDGNNNPPTAEVGARTIWNRINRRIPNLKRRKSYPAVKVGRLGVAAKYQSSGLGGEILDLLKMAFVCDNKTGCRFITVDAYNNPRTMKFYQKNDFDFLITSDEKEDTRQMYFDLQPFYKLSLQSSQQPVGLTGNLLQNVPPLVP